jgi:hypothetical protein
LIFDETVFDEVSFDEMAFYEVEFDEASDQLIFAIKLNQLKPPISIG